MAIGVGGVAGTLVGVGGTLLGGVSGGVAGMVGVGGKPIGVLGLGGGGDGCAIFGTADAFKAASLILICSFFLWSSSSFCFLAAVATARFSCSSSSWAIFN